MPAPDPASDEVRAEEKIRGYGVLEDADMEDLRALAELAAVVGGVPHAAINLVTSTHQHQVASFGIDPSVCDRGDSMCAAVLTHPEVVVVRDASEDPRFAANRMVTGDLGAVRFFASAPLTAPDGTTFGRLCVFDDEPHDLTTQGARVLEVLAARVVDVLELRLRARQLTRSLTELTEARDELNRSNENLALFAGQVSHDLRSPLTAILANSELLLGEPSVTSDPAAVELAQANVAAAQRMAGLIDSILAYTRVGASLDVGDVALDHVVDDVVADLAPLLTARGATISRGDLPVVHADARLIYSVVLNLVSNAVKFVGPGRAPVIEVRARRDGEGWWRVTVSDNGPGVPADQRESHFLLYARGHHSIEGSGIGLATARRIIEAHGGRMGIEDASGGGASVWFTIPG